MNDDKEQSKHDSAVITLIGYWEELDFLQMLDAQHIFLNVKRLNVQAHGAYNRTNTDMERLISVLFKSLPMSATDNKN